MVIIILGMIFGLIFVWVKDYNYIDNKQPVKDHIKRVLLISIFAPLQANLLG